MIAVDTNVLLRFFLHDHAEQGRVARRFFERLADSGETCFVSSVTMAEFIWVLQRRYNVLSEQLPAIIETILGVPNLTVEHEPALRHALAATGGNFSDRLIHFVGATVGCERTVTFDRRFAKLNGVELLKT